MDTGGFIQPVEGEAERCRHDGSVADKFLPVAHHCDECQPFTQPPGSTEGMLPSALQLVMLGILATAIFSTTRRLDIFPSAAAAGRDVVSDAPCVLGDELQRCVDGSSGVLVPSVPAAAQHDPTCQSAVCIEPVHQPGHSPAHSFLLLLHPIHGEQPAIVQFKGLEINGSP